MFKFDLVDSVQVGIYDIPGDQHVKSIAQEIKIDDKTPNIHDTISITIDSGVTGITRKHVYSFVAGNKR